MTDIDTSTDEARFDLSGLRLGWSDARTERLLTAVQGRLVRRRRAWRAAITSVAVAGGVGAVVFGVVGGRAPAVRGPALAERATRTGERVARTGERVIRLAEGSEIRPQATAEVRVIDEQVSRVRVEQVRGSSRYQVVPNPVRTFEVSAGSVTVTVVGTEFVVERRGEVTSVQVERGKVRVEWGAGEGAQRVLGAGESGLFPPPAAVAPASVPRTPGSAAASHGPHAALGYRAQVARQDYQGAYAALSREPALAGETVEELLVAADVARLSDHPAQAVSYLQRIVRDHPRDQRAPLAAFTLGRTLSGLGRQRQAMEMFARVHSAWPDGPLAEDALVREAEAAFTLGDTARAARLAAQYERAYPRGGRRAEVRRYAQLPQAD